jgi:hypothetical protein
LRELIVVEGYIPLPVKAELARGLRDGKLDELHKLGPRLVGSEALMLQRAPMLSGILGLPNPSPVTVTPARRRMRKGDIIWIVLLALIFLNGFRHCVQAMLQ